MNYTDEDFEHDWDELDEHSSELLQIIDDNGGSIGLYSLVNSFFQIWNNTEELYDRFTVRNSLKKLIKAGLVKKVGWWHPEYTLTKRSDGWFEKYSELATPNA